MGQFSFLVEVSGIATDNATYEDVLYSAGCDDALIMVVDGHLKLDFDRQAQSYELAVESALRDIERAGGKVSYVEKSKPNSPSAQAVGG